MIEKIQLNNISTAVTPSFGEKMSDTKDNKESLDFVKKHALEIGLGTAALAAAVIGGIYYMRSGKGSDGAKTVVKQGEEILTGAGSKSPKSSEVNAKVPDGKEPAITKTEPIPSKPAETPEQAKPVKPAEETKTSANETAPEEIKPSNTALTPAIIKEARKLYDSAPRNLREVIEENQKLFESYDFVKKPFSTDFKSYDAAVISDKILKHKSITNENGKLIMDVWSEDGQNVNLIGLYNPETGNRTYTLYFKKIGELTGIGDLNNKKRLNINKNKVDMVSLYKDKVYGKESFNYCLAGVNSGCIYGTNNDIKTSYWYYNDLKILDAITIEDKLNNIKNRFIFNSDGSLISYK